MGGLRPTENGGVTSNVFGFSVSDTAVVTEVDNALTSGKRVKLHYRQVWTSGVTQGSTDYFITKVEVVDPSVEIGK